MEGKKRQKHRSKHRDTEMKWWQGHKYLCMTLLEIKRLSNDRNAQPRTLLKGDERRSSLLAMEWAKVIGTDNICWTQPIVQKGQVQKRLWPPGQIHWDLAIIIYSHTTSSGPGWEWKMFTFSAHGSEKCPLFWKCRLMCHNGLQRHCRTWIQERAWVAIVFPKSQQV